MRADKVVAAYLALLSAAWLAGCGGGDDLPRRAISGVVAFDGRPLDGGRIEFQPIGPGVTAGGAIEGGAYRIARDEGPTPGRYRVNISAPGETGPAPEPQGGDPGRGRPGAAERIPARYNASSGLAVEVVTTGSGQFDFTLESLGGPPASPPLRRRKP